MLQSGFKTQILQSGFNTAPLVDLQMSHSSTKFSTKFSSCTLYMNIYSVFGVFFFKKGRKSVDVKPVTAMRMAHAHGTRVRRRHPRPPRQIEAPDQAYRSIEPKFCRSW